MFVIITDRQFKKKCNLFLVVFNCLQQQGQGRRARIAETEEVSKKISKHIKNEDAAKM